MDLSRSGEVQVSLASSSDLNHPPESIIDGNPDTFWSTTGLFPQELILTFTSQTSLSAINTKSTSVRKMIVEGSIKNEGPNFERIVERDLTMQDGRVQSEDFKFDKPHAFKRLKLILDEGYGHFAAVYAVHITRA